MKDHLLPAAQPVSPAFSSFRAVNKFKNFTGTPLSTRTIAVLHYVDGWTLEEVAQEVSLSVSGVRKRLRVLRQHLHGIEEGTWPA